MARKQVKLKNYDLYLAKLKKYTRASRIKLVTNDIESSYSPTARRIRLDTDLPQSHVIASLLHELGHSMDDLLVPKYLKSLDKAYTAIYKDKQTAAQMTLVIDCEKRAWDYGRKIATILNIRLGKWYDDYQKACLAAYRT